MIARTRNVSPGGVWRSDRTALRDELARLSPSSRPRENRAEWGEKGEKKSRPQKQWNSSRAGQIGEAASELLIVRRRFLSCVSRREARIIGFLARWQVARPKSSVDLFIGRLPLACPRSRGREFHPRALLRKKLDRARSPFSSSVRLASCRDSSWFLRTTEKFRDESYGLVTKIISALRGEEWNAKKKSS